MIYIVIPHYIISDELKELATNTIKSFRSSSNSEIKIISVDDGSPEDTSFLQELSDYYLKNEKNLGFAPTCNKGFKKVFELEKDDCFIVCANNDIEVYPGWIEAMTEPFVRWPDTGITGLISYRTKMPENVPIKDWKIRKITHGGFLSSCGNGWMQSGGLWMTKKSIMEECGMFDEQFKIGGYEDVDLFLRYRDKCGKKIIMSGMSPFWHKEGATRWWQDTKPRNKMHEEENRKKFAQKWGFDYWNGSCWKEYELWNG